MNDRETTTYKVSNGDEIVLKTYITAREKREINAVIFTAFGQSEENATTKNNAIVESQNATLKTVIVSINGKKDGQDIDGVKFSVIEYLLDLKQSVFKEVLSKVDESLSDSEEKKTL